MPFLLLLLLVRFTYFNSYILLGLCSFYLQIKNTGIRNETFKKNFALIENKYGEVHREALGKETSINKYGYPDIGNNLYADLLPYKDWVRVNNAQRAHESLVNSLIIVYPNAFIASLVYPKVTVGLLYALLLFRTVNINGYLSNRGYNKAVGGEEFSKLTLVLLISTSMLASLSMLGVTRKFAIFKKLVPKRVSNRYPSLKYTE